MDVVTLGIVSGAVAGSTGAGIYFYRKLQKQLKKQSYQLNTIEELYKEVQRASEVVDRNALQTMEALVRALEARDGYTRGHSDRVHHYAGAIGRQMNLPDHELIVLKDAALLHDIGKIGVYDRILFKEGPLTEEEFKLMKMHPTLGAQILSSLSYLKDHIPLVRYHHERQDGRGYPAGLIGDQIPLGARIIQVADTWDAMSTNRPYRKSLSLTTAIKELQVHKHTQFDGRVVEAFLDWLSQTKQTKKLLSPKEYESAFQPTF